MGYVAPAIIQAWGVDKASLGPVLGAGMFGMLVGSLALSVLADRIGRRPVLIGASLFFAIIMLATAHVADIDQLMVMLHRRPCRPLAAVFTHGSIYL